MNNLELGRIAYEAYCNNTNWKSVITGDTLPPFHDTPKAVQEGWVAVAVAVREVL